jgi:hypothetical protein
MDDEHVSRMLCLFGPSSREMRSFCRPEVQSLYLRELQDRLSVPIIPSELLWDTLHDSPDFMLEWVWCADKGTLCRVAKSSSTLTALIEVRQ